MKIRLDAVCDARKLDDITAPSVAVEGSPQGAQGVVRREPHSPY